MPPIILNSYDIIAIQGSTMAYTIELFELDIVSAGIFEDVSEITAEGLALKQWLDPL